MQTTQTILPIRTDQADAKTKRLLESASEFGRATNMMKTMARSAAALDGYLRLKSALAEGTLNPSFREQIALVVAQANGCRYSLSEHATLAGRLRLEAEVILASRGARSNDPKLDAGLKWARDLAVRSPEKSAADIRALRHAGYSDEEIVEIIANVAFNVYANYFNIVAGTDVDFPQVEMNFAAA